MGYFEKYQWLIMIIAIFVGLALGQLERIAETAAYFIVPSLMIMLYGIFLQIPLGRLKEGFTNVRVALLSLLINFIWTPLLAFFLAYVFFRNNPDVFVALIMDMVTPCTDWYLIFTSIAGGNLAFSVSLLPWNLVFQLVLLPVYLFLFAGTVVEIQPFIFLFSFLRVLLAPFIIAVITRNIMRSVKGDTWFTDKIPGKTGALQSSFLLLAITAMFASQGSVLIENMGLVIRLVIPVTLFFIINFSLGQLIGRYFKLSYEDGTSLIMTVLARNAPLALTIAVAVFPGRPLIPLVLAVESLIELPLLFVVSQVMLLIYRKKWWPNLV